MKFDRLVKRILIIYDFYHTFYLGTWKTAHKIRKSHWNRVNYDITKSNVILSVENSHTVFETRFNYGLVNHSKWNMVSKNVDHKFTILKLAMSFEKLRWNMLGDVTWTGTFFFRTGQEKSTLTNFKGSKIVIGLVPSPGGKFTGTRKSLKGLKKSQA